MNVDYQLRVVSNAYIVSCSVFVGTGGFLPGVKQIANVAALPGIVGYSVGLPDVHAGYGFAIGK